MSSKTAELDKEEIITEVEGNNESSPGRRLKDERERLGLKTEDVAMRLRLRISVIEAIERDDYSEMVADVFMKGYIRSYAKLLALEPDALISCLESLGVSKTAKPSPTHLWQNFKPHEKKEKPFKVMFIISVGFTVLLMLAWLSNAFIFNKKKDPLKSESVAMKVLGTSELAKSDLSTLQPVKKNQKIAPIIKVAAQSKGKSKG